MEAGELLRRARKRQGVTQQQLATRARTSQAAISRIERGVVSPTFSTLDELLDLLGEKLELSSQPADYGFDPTLHDRKLRMTHEERIEDQAAHANATREFQRLIGVEPARL